MAHFPSHGGFQLMQSQPFWVQPPHIHPTKVLWTKNKLPNGRLLPPVATALNLNMSRPSAKTTKCISVSTPVIIYKALFSSSSYALHTQEWFSRARVIILCFMQDSTLRRLVVWLVGPDSRPILTHWPHQSTESFESKLADAGNPLVQQLGRHLSLPRVVLKSPMVNWRWPKLSRLVEAAPNKVAKSTQWLVSNIIRLP
jgi:hypothetical protein